MFVIQHAIVPGSFQLVVSPQSEKRIDQHQFDRKEPFFMLQADVRSNAYSVRCF
jgi:hypothetical protein